MIRENIVMLRAELSRAPVAVFVLLSAAAGTRVVAAYFGMTADYCGSVRAGGGAHG